MSGRYRYQAIFSSPTRDLIPSAGTTEDRLNRIMGEFGFDETLTLGTSFPVELSSILPLEKHYLDKAHAIAEETLREKFPRATLGPWKEVLSK